MYDTICDRTNFLLITETMWLRGLTPSYIIYCIVGIQICSSKQDEKHSWHDTGLISFDSGKNHFQHSTVEPVGQLEHQKRAESNSKIDLSSVRNAYLWNALHMRNILYS